MKNYYTKIIYSTLFMLSAFITVSAQNSHSHQRIDDTSYSCQLPPAPFEGFVSIPRTDYIETRMANNSTPCATFIVEETSFLTEEQRTAFQFATDIWANLIVSSVPIRIRLGFAPLGETTLAQASSVTLLVNEPEFEPSTAYVPSLGESLIGEDRNGPNGTSIDFEITFSTEFPFYLGLDASPPSNQTDFVTVALHEIGHGLGVSGSARVNGNIGSLRFNNGEFVRIWDRFIEGTDIILRPEPILDFPDPSSQLFLQFTGGNLTTSSPTAISQNGGESPEIYAPSTFQPGSSYSHLDGGTFRGSENALMIQSVGRGVGIHNPGPIILGMLQDMGWVLCQNALSTDDFALENVTISPNPFTESLTINLPSEVANQEFDVTIVDINGRVVSSDSGSSNGEIIVSNLNNLKSALYFLTIKSKTSDLSITKKIVKQ